MAGCRDTGEHAHTAIYKVGRESENSHDIMRLRTVCVATMLKGRASTETTLELV